MSEEEFARECFRCGRCIEKAGEHIWRWTAFHFGLDLVVCLDSTTLRIKRNHRLDTDRSHQGQSQQAQYNSQVSIR